MPRGSPRPTCRPAGWFRVRAGRAASGATFARSVRRGDQFRDLVVGRDGEPAGRPARSTRGRRQAPERSGSARSQSRRTSCARNTRSRARIRQPSIVPPTGWSALAPHASSGSNGIGMTALSPGPAAMTARKRREPMTPIVARRAARLRRGRLARDGAATITTESGDLRVLLRLPPRGYACPIRRVRSSLMRPLSPVLDRQAPRPTTDGDLQQIAVWPACALGTSMERYHLNEPRP